MRASIYTVLFALGFVSTGCSVPDFHLIDAGGGSGSADAGKMDAAIDALQGDVSVTDVSSSAANNLYGPSASIPIQVTFEEAVMVDTGPGTPTLLLNTTALASYTSGSGTATLTFTYQVAAGHLTPDLDYAGSDALTLNGTSIRDVASGRDVRLQLPTPGSAGSLGGNKSIGIDAVAPVVSTISGPAMYNASTSGNLTYSVTETNLGSTTCTHTAGTGTTGSCTATGAAFTALSQGAHTITVTHTDLAGNVGTRTYSWTVDTVAPVVSTPTGPASFSSATSSSVSYTVTDANPGSTTCTQTVGSGTVPTCNATTMSLTALSEGAHTITIRHTDLAGNMSTVVPYSWTVDTIAPVVSMISGPGNTTASTATLTYSVTELNQNATTCTQVTGTGTETACTASMASYTGLSVGQHTVRVTHTDRAGNASAAQTYTWSACPPMSFITPTTGVSYTVPSGCGTTMEIYAWGGGGAGGFTTGSGAGAGFASGRLTVTAGQVFQIAVAGGGRYEVGGINGGGNAVYDSGSQAGGGGGGGASGVLMGGNRLVIAGGGGGHGECGSGAAGAGGGTSGGPGAPGGGGAGGGGGASQTGPGGGGVGAFNGMPGSPGSGSSGGNANGGGLCPGGAGGGGYFGGGAGGGVRDVFSGGGGGGGGSSFVHSSLTSPSILAGSGQTPGGTASPYYQAGRGTGSGETGGNGLVVVFVHP